LALTGIEPVAK